MEEQIVSYIGEHLLTGEIGNFFVILAFISSVLSAYSYFRSVQVNAELKSGWRSLGRLGFRIHSLAVIGIVATLFVMLFNHYFEFYYVWQHSNTEMDMQYIASCFWEGQEGSFLLWIFWHILIGNLLIFSFRKQSEELNSGWESPVMAVFALVQIFLCSMLLGVYFFEYKVGSNPFTVLLREHSDFKDLPFLQNPNYLEKLDGRGLNPLLQNYWMVIHPPTLFLGFGLTLVPFAFAIAGLWTRQFNDWQRPALSWTFFGIAVLGIGILMGGAWAYEALSFGGFWAWDPVENASLVPWLTLVGAGHVMMIHKNKGQSLFATFFLSLISFLLVLYSTFLTRSGILGDSSVHAFTDLGMSGQLLVYLLFFVLLGIILLAIRYKELPKLTEEENIFSREFWMFIGALVLLISAFQISLTTSIPVINKIFDTNMAPPAEGKVAEHYHQWQIPFSILILILMASAQFLKYKKTEAANFGKQILLPAIIALVLSFSFSIYIDWLKADRSIFYALLLFAGLYSVFGNLSYWIRVLKGRMDHAGASVAHIGFALLLIGALISTGLSEKISINQKGDVEIFGKDFSNRDNILLQRNDTVKMGDYLVTYKGARKEGVNVLYDVDYLLNKNEQTELAFSLSPRIQTNPRMGNVAEPDTRHFLSKDIYTHVTYADLSVVNNTNEEGFKEPANNNVAPGDTFFTSNSIVVLEGLRTGLDKEALNISTADIAVGAKLKVFDVYGKIWEPMPIYYIVDSFPNTIEARVEELGLRFAFWQIHPESGKIDISVSEKVSSKKDFIVMKAIVFPGINILWAGCILMGVGTLMAVRKRVMKRS